MHSHIGYLIKTINDKIKVRADTDLKKHNLTMTQSRVLLYLFKNSGTASQKEIENFLEVSHPTVVGLVDRLCKNGFVTFSIDLKDRRNKIVQLTEMGYNTGKNMDKIIEKMEEKMLSPLNEEEVGEMTRMLELIYNNLDC